MRGVIATGRADPDELVDKARAIPKMEGSDLVRGVTCAEPFDYTPIESDDPGFVLAPNRRAKRPLRVAAYDYGMKWNILRRFAAHGCDVRVFPATTPASELLATKPDGVFLSNGPGDPAVLDYAIANARELVTKRRADVRHLPRPPDSRPRDGRPHVQAQVRPSRRQPSGERDLQSGKIEITSQNHGFAVDPGHAAARRRR